jgi:hypothetical protein
LIPQRFGFPKLICKEKNRKEKIATKLRINGLGFFSKWTGLKFVKKKKYRSDFGKISEKQ